VVGVLRRAVIYGGQARRNLYLGCGSFFCLSDAAYIPVRTNVWKAAHEHIVKRDAKLLNEILHPFVHSVDFVANSLPLTTYLDPRVPCSKLPLL
jgi:hypothetical protein